MRNKIVYIVIILIISRLNLFSQTDRYIIKIDSVSPNEFITSINNFIIDKTTLGEVEKEIGKGKIERERVNKGGYVYKTVWSYYSGFCIYSRVYLKGPKNRSPEIDPRMKKIKKIGQRSYKKSVIYFFCITDTAKHVYLTFPNKIKTEIIIGKTTFEEINSKIKSTNKFPKDRTLHYFSRKLSIEFENDELSPNYGKAIEIVVY